MDNKIKLDYSRNSLFDEIGITRLKDSYMMENEIDPQERFAFVSKSFATNEAHAQRLYDYSSKHWLSYSTPILSFGRSKKGLPISCYLNYIEDTTEGLVDNLTETNWLSVLGGGVGVHMGIRGVDEKSTGLMPHIKTYEASCQAYKQGRTRRGSYAIYTDISHPDIIQFLEMRKPTGDPNLRALHLNHGINIPDSFMELLTKAMSDETIDDSWPLIQPNTGQVVETVSAKELWAKIIELRANTGEPYLWFIDAANRGLPDYQQSAGLRNNGSNLCSEISLATSKDRTAVCCLSSVNLKYYDEWKNDKKFLADVLEMLDNVIQYFILNAPNEISRAKFSAYRERSVGIGVLGFHAYLQSKLIPFESAMATSINKAIFAHIRKELDEKNHELALSRGPCPDAADYNVMKRNSHVMSIAPTASASIIMGNTSPSTEPYAGLVYRQDTLSGVSINIVREFKDFVENYAEEHSLPNSWLEDQWESIIANKGSCQHLEWISDADKEVFKTAREINQEWIIAHAIDRQPYIDQAQSVNIYVNPDISIPRLHMLHYMAWKGGLKGLYYCRSGKIGEIDKMSKKVERIRIEDENTSVSNTSTDNTTPLIWSNVDSSICLACQ